MCWHSALIAQFVFLALRTASCEPSIITIEMTPKGVERIVDEGEFNITCRIVLTNYYDGSIDAYCRNIDYLRDYIEWTLPDVYSENQLKTDYHDDCEKGNCCHSITITSTLTVFDATSKETGYYSCAKRISPSSYPNVTQYIYVKGKHSFTLATYNAAFIDTFGDINVFKLDANERTDVVIPLKTTHPSVDVRLYYVTSINSVISNYTKAFYYQEGFVSANSKYVCDHHFGLTLKNVTPSDSGTFSFLGNLENNTLFIHVHFRVEGIELTVDGGNDEIVEGSNVTLVCIAVSEFTETPIWRYGKTTASMKDIDEEHPPKDLASLRVNITHNPLEKQSKVSRLHLFNVTRQFRYNHFECSALLRFTNGRKRKTSNIISIQLKSIANENFENVEMEVGSEKTIKCTTTEAGDNTEFQWFKDKKPIGTTGPSAAEFKLYGRSPDDAGLYECEYADKSGKPATKTFVVKLHDSKTKKITLIVSLLIVAVLIVIVIGLLWFYRSRRRGIFPNAEKLLEGGKDDANNTSIYTKKEDEACAQPYDKQLEFPRNRLKLSGAEIGAGHFGRVVKGEATGISSRSGKHVTTVAVKMIKSQNMDAFRELECLVAELKILIYLGSHVNVVGLLGACTKNITRGELLVILEYCRFGNLKSFLNDPNHEFISKIDDGYVKAIQKEAAISGNGTQPICAPRSPLPSAKAGREQAVSTSADEAQLYDDIVIKNGINPLGSPTCAWQNQSDGCLKIAYSIGDLISWSWQLTRGMGHLANKKVVHGDLAARNVLLADNGVVKVADFGLAHRTYYKDYVHKEEKGPLPVKWMAIETLTDGTFTSQSDVWSYGVTLWELFSLGKVPYPGIEGKRMLNELESGYRMDKPTDAPDFIGDVMKSCWERKPTERPTFNQLEKTVFNFVNPSAKSYYLQLVGLEHC